MAIATHKKDLRTGHPIWFAYKTPAIATERLKSDKKADVLIIGAGISGAMVAEELTEAGLSVMMIDRRGPLKGSTSASTALLQYEIDTPLIHLTRKIGHDDATRAWRRSKLGLESLSVKIRSLDIACDMDRRNSLYLSGSILNPDQLQQEGDARKVIGLHSEFLNRTELKERFNLRHQAALHSYDSIALNPRKLTAGLLNKALERGMKIYAPCTALSVDTGKRNVRVETDEGYTITAKHVIFATGYEIPKDVKARKHKIHSTWAFATKSQPSKLWPEQAFIWEASDPYLYVRTLPDGRIICGGEDEDFSDENKRDAIIPQKIKALQRKLHELFPHIDVGADYSWAGSFGGSTTGLPSIGEMPGKPNCYCIMAFGGNGITFSRIAAEIIVAQLTGKNDPEADLFAFH